MRWGHGQLYIPLLLGLACSPAAGPTQAPLPHSCGAPACTTGKSFDLTAVANYASEDSYARLASADLNGDGMLDLAALSATTNAVDIFFGQTDGGLLSPTRYQGIWSSLALSDLDGDGFVDIIGSGGRGIVVFFNQGDGTFFPPLGIDLTIDGDAYPIDVAIGDVNGDGNPDIVTCGFLGVDVILNQGTRSFAPPAKLLSGRAGTDITTVLTVLTSTGTASPTLRSICGLSKST